MLENAASLATWNPYVSAVDPVVTAFRTTSVTGCSANLKIWPSLGEVGVGIVRVTPVRSSGVDLPVEGSAAAVTAAVAGAEGPAGVC